MLLDRTELSRLIPHAGTMCLLDGVLAWDTDSIRCISRNHHDPNNPLRRNGRLSAVCAFEYGAQAAAVHGGLCADGGLCAGGRFVPAYLAALKDGRCYVNALDDIPEPLHVEAWLQFRGDGNQIYQTRVSAAGMTISEVRITVMSIQQHCNAPLASAGCQ